MSFRRREEYLEAGQPKLIRANLTQANLTQANALISLKIRVADK